LSIYSYRKYSSNLPCQTKVFFTLNVIIRDCKYRKKTLVWHGELDEYLPYIMPYLMSHGSNKFWTRPLPSYNSLQSGILIEFVKGSFLIKSSWILLELFFKRTQLTNELNYTYCFIFLVIKEKAGYNKIKSSRLIFFSRKMRYTPHTYLSNSRFWWVTRIFFFIRCIAFDVFDALDAYLALFQVYSNKCISVFFLLRFNEENCKIK
jgi:hypothetical protein